MELNQSSLTMVETPCLMDKGRCSILFVKTRKQTSYLPHSLMKSIIPNRFDDHIYIAMVLRRFYGNWAC